MDDAILKVQRLSVNIQSEQGALHAVDNLSFTLEKSKTFALLGESGCGKSMAALSILQLLPAMATICSESSVKFHNENLLNKSELALRQLRGKTISMIFQEPMTSLNPVMTIGQQLDEVLVVHANHSKNERQIKIIELLNDVGLSEPSQQIHNYPHQLSGGMKQRVMIAMAIAVEPEVLIADEPTTALDVTIQAQILNLLKALQQKNGMAILLITHDLGVVRQMAHNVGVMYAGHLVELSSADEFFADAKHPYSQKLFDSLPGFEHRNNVLRVIKGAVPNLTEHMPGCRFTNRCPYSQAACNQSAAKWLKINQTSHHVRCHIYDSRYASLFTANYLNNKRLLEKRTVKLENTLNIKSEEIILSIHDLKVHFPIRKGVLKRTIGYVKAVDGVSLTLCRGETLAIVGESGSGKTTMGRSILKLINSTSGEINYLNHQISNLSNHGLSSLRQEMQIIFQDPFSSMNPRMTVGEIIKEGMLANQLFKTKNEYTQRIIELLLQVGLAENVIHRYPNEFSGGQRQRICIARALAVEPKVIICDEPTSALDVSVQAQILNLLRDLQRRYKLSYLFITHNISVVSYIADRVAVMHQGKIIEQGLTKQILMNPQHAYTKKLLNAVPHI